jgi:hypothetical protein
MSADGALAFIEAHGVVLVAARGPVPRQHTASGKHVNRIVDFPRWVPASVRAAARDLSDAEAERVLAAMLVRGRPRTAAKKTPRSRATAAASRKRVRGT